MEGRIPFDCYSVKSRVIQNNHSISIQSESLECQQRVVRLHHHVRGVIPIGENRVCLRVRKFSISVAIIGEYTATQTRRHKRADRLMHGDNGVTVEVETVLIDFSGKINS